MPNWCTNNITISGPTETIKQLWEDAHPDTEAFELLNAMAPMPAELEDTTSPSEDGNDWYSWRVNNWGTKWDVSDEGLEYIDNEDGTSEITGWFDSAWAPPIGAYNKFLDDMDNCSIQASYHEPGMDYAGFYSDGEDEYLENLYDEYKLAEDERSDLYNRLDEEYALSENYEMWDEDEEDLEEGDAD